MIKRYQMDYYEDEAYMSQAKDGDWVKVEDHESWKGRASTILELHRHAMNTNSSYEDCDNSALIKDIDELLGSKDGD